MALKQTVHQMRTHLMQIVQDLDKADRGNKAASQRVRTGTIRLEKIAKLFRKESIKEEKTSKGKKKPAKASAKTAPKKAAKHTAPKKAVKHSGSKQSASKQPAAKHSMAKHPAAKKAVKGKAKPKAQATKSKKATAGSRALSLQRRQTAKLPRRTMR